MSATETRKTVTAAGAWRRVAALATPCVPAFVLFLLPAVWNGFPLVFSDSGTYLRAAIERYNPADRPIYYSIFLYLLHWRISLWPVVVVQAAGTVAVLAIFLRRCLGPLPGRHLAALLALAGAATSLPVFACQIMPDLFTPVMVLALATLVFRDAVLTPAERWFLLLTVLAAVCFHQANFLIAAGTLASAFLVRLAIVRPAGPGRPFVMPALAVVLGVGLLVLPNYLAHRMVAVTRGSGAFLLAKTIGDGVGLDYLTARCPQRHYSICPALPAIRHYAETATPQEKWHVPTTDYVLWHGPVKQAGGWGGVAPYAEAVSLDAIQREPAQFALASLHGFGQQLLRFATGGLSRYDPASYVASAIRLYFPARTGRAFLNSRQEAGGLGIDALTPLDEAAAAAATACLVLLLVIRGDPTLKAIALTLVAAVLANAFVTGALSAVHDRYQSRVIGLVVLAALLLGYRQLMEWRSRRGIRKRG